MEVKVRSVVDEVRVLREEFEDLSVEKDEVVRVVEWEVNDFWVKFVVC